MKLTFLGATGEVTGSNYLVECNGKKIFVDYGIHQGGDDDEKNRETSPVNPGELDALLLTHAHMDHSGRIPYLVRNGFKGRIWLTRATGDLVGVLWYDSARLMKEETEWKNRKNSRKGLPLLEPLYDETDVTASLKFLQPIDYETPTEILPGITACFHYAGHILGSSSISLSMKENGKDLDVVFSGDLGPQVTAMENAPAVIKKANYTLIESTYGNRLHKDFDETRAEFRAVITEAIKDKGKVLIPSFVVDRAQRILYEILLMQLEKLIPDDIPIFFDSPMGVKATEIYRKHSDTLSEEIQKFIANGHDPFAPHGLTYVSSVEQSQSINSVPHCIVIAGSGMCSGGRIVHHLKHSAWNPKNHVIFVGYQGYGTLGRRIVDGEKDLRIAGEDVHVAAQIHTLGGFSSHGDRDDLLAWAENFETNPLFFVTHGELTSAQALSATLGERGMRSFVPSRGQEFELVPDVVLRSEDLVKAPLPAAAPTVRNAEFDRTLNELTTLISQLRREVETSSLVKMDEIMPLLQSGRTLLETARGKVGV